MTSIITVGDHVKEVVCYGKASLKVETVQKVGVTFDQRYVDWPSIAQLTNKFREVLQNPQTLIYS